METNHPTKRTTTLLTYFGAIPFLIAVFIGLSPYLSLPEFLGGEIAYSGFKAKALMHSYAVVILSFIAGIQWGISLHDNKKTLVLWLSSFLALLAWISLMAFATKMALSVLFFGFIVALVADRKAYINHIIPVWFWQLRKKISFIVCLSLLTIILLK